MAFTRSHIDKISEVMPLFNPKNAAEMTEEVQAYLKYYQLNDKNHFSYGRVKVGEYDIACYYYEPPKARGTVLLFHGYLDNSGILYRLQNQLIALNYAVLMADLPGHGFSSGKRGSITDFTEYGELSNAMIAIHKEHSLPNKLHLMGHSTGAAVILDQLARYGKTWDGETIFFAPLVRSAFWGISRWGHKLAKPFTTEMDRLYRVSSHDTTFLQFLQDEPLTVTTFPMQWGSALYKWNDSMEGVTFPDIPLTVIQGTKDGTVGWRHNMRFYKKRFPQVKTHIITGGRHHLINESDAYRLQVEKIVNDVMNRE